MVFEGEVVIAIEIESSRKVTKKVVDQLLIAEKGHGKAREDKNDLLHGNKRTNRNMGCIRADGLMKP